MFSQSLQFHYVVFIDIEKLEAILIPREIRDKPYIFPDNSAQGFNPGELVVKVEQHGYNQLGSSTHALIKANHQPALTGIDGFAHKGPASSLTMIVNREINGKPGMSAAFEHSILAFHNSSPGLYQCHPALQRPKNRLTYGIAITKRVEIR
jgi:hypothetical protein